MAILTGVVIASCQSVVKRLAVFFFRFISPKNNAVSNLAAIDFGGISSLRSGIPRFYGHQTGCILYFPTKKSKKNEPDNQTIDQKFRQQKTTATAVRETRLGPAGRGESNFLKGQSG